MKGEPKGRSPSTKDQKPPCEKRKLLKPLSLSHFTFDEIVDAALTTKPKRRAKKHTDDAEKGTRKPRTQ